MSDMYDVIVIGGGISGLTATIYLRRKLLKTLIISVDVGGQLNLAKHLENYPGYTGKDGYGLIKVVSGQVSKFGADFVTGEVNSVEKRGDTFNVKLSNGDSYDAKAVILAFGKIPRKLGIPGENKFMGKGVHTCATCDAPLMNDKVVAVVGGGNSALEAVELLSKFAKKVYLIHRRDEFRADEIIVEKVKNLDNVEFVLKCIPVEIRGSEVVESIVVKNVETGEQREIGVDGVFVEIGYETNTSFVKNLVKINDRNEIVINERCETSCEGVFACGDVTNVPYKQAIISAGEGAKAALSAYEYLMRKKGKRAVMIDWAMGQN